MSLDLIRTIERHRRPLMQQHLDLPRSPWHIWSFTEGEHGYSILDYKGVQVAYLPYGAGSERELRAVTLWLEQWAGQLNYAHHRGTENLLILCASLLDLCKRTYSHTLAELVIERKERVG